MYHFTREKLDRIKNACPKGSPYSLSLCNKHADNSNYINSKHARSFNYVQSENPRFAYYYCNLKGEWKDEGVNGKGIAAFLVKKKISGNICFTDSSYEETLFLIHSYFIGEKLYREVGAVINVKTDVMQFLHRSINRVQDLRIRITLDELPQIFDALPFFLNTNEAMDMQFTVKDFSIES